MPSRCWHCDTLNPYITGRESCYACARPPEPDMPSGSGPPEPLSVAELRIAVGYLPDNAQMLLVR